jgi:hypothetical protein
MSILGLWPTEGFAYTTPEAQDGQVNSGARTFDTAMAVWDNRDKGVFHVYWRPRASGAFLPDVLATDLFEELARRFRFFS